MAYIYAEVIYRNVEGQSRLKQIVNAQVDGDINDRGTMLAAEMKVRSLCPQFVRDNIIDLSFKLKYAPHQIGGY